MKYLEFEAPIQAAEEEVQNLRRSGADGAAIEAAEGRVREARARVYAGLTAIQRAQVARHPDRPHALDLLERMAEDLLFLHGDRAFGDDPAVVAALAVLSGREVLVVAQEKGRETREKIARNFGMAHPEGYRKAMRLAALAARFRRPVVTLIDTPGAYPGTGAEERGQAEAIAASLAELSALPAPIVAAVVGEGGSGGALALAVADRVLILENAVYSVISPEGCAAILFGDARRAADAADALRLAPRDLAEAGVIDEIVAEPEGGAHRDIEGTAGALREALRRHLDEVEGGDPAALVARRRARYRRMGRFSETEA
jgi:acetyl-CoA carboxylase carboxyl transferase subunit alpha